ncbi:MAG: HAMP domain-containing histidine kinase [Myxococcales bacterium]|nr:HAMP domain-containing histidine kinase [Myxococcales bacterium]
MTRLSQKIYAAFIGVLLLFFVLGGLLIWATDGRTRGLDFLQGAAALAGATLPPDGAPAEQLNRKIELLSAEMGVSVGLFSAEGAELAGAGGFVPAPEVERGESHWVRAGRRSAGASRLPDGRWLVLRMERHPSHGFAWLGPVAALLAAIGLGAYPLARSITRRLERLDERVVALGAGQLSSRAPVEGRDEVARLARSFNRTAEQVEALVESQRTLLAGASHELRSPLARLRVATELIGSEAAPELRDQLERDVDRLDRSVEELLLASRLELAGAADRTEPVDLLALAAEEASATDAEVSGEPTTIQGDRASLRHLLRNLLQNAERHAPGPVEIDVRPSGAGARIRVDDRGPGVPESERETIFEPFRRGSGAAPGGAGLGLALARQVARHHHGDLRVFSREGGGTRFEVELRNRSLTPTEGDS